MFSYFHTVSGIYSCMAFISKYSSDDVRLYFVLLLQSLNAVGHLWKRGPTIGINIGGLAASVYLLFRTAALFNGSKE